MTNDQHDAFISYRREGGSDIARVIQVELSGKHGRKPFLDLKELTRQGGAFDEKLLDTVKNVDNFILILSPGALDRCQNEDDWVRKEVAHAISSNKNIIPIELDGFAAPSEGLPVEIQGILRIQRVKYNRFYHDAAIQLISDRFIVSGEADGPVSAKGADLDLKERADNFLARGKERLCTADYVEALRYLQMSILCKENAETHFFAGIALAAVLESPAYVKREFEKCLSIDGSLEDAQLALSFIADISGSSAVEAIDRRLLKDGLLHRLSRRLANPVPRPLLRVLTPSWAQNWWLIFWIASAAVSFSLTTSLRVGFGDEARFLQTGIKFVFFCGCLFCLNTCSGIFGNVYFALRHMAAPKARHGFDDWFSEWMGRIFGVIPNGDHSKGLYSGSKQSRIFWITVGFFILLVAIAPFFLLFRAESGALLALRWTEFFIATIPGIFFSPCLLLSFAFFKDCSRMPMRPAISSADRNMLSRLSNVVIVGVAAATICFLLESVWGISEYNDNKVQLAFYLVSIVIGMSWSLLAPIYFSRAIANARDAVLSQYGDHIEDALHSFVFDPNDKNLAKCKWLIENQRVLDGIQASLLSRRDLAILTILNIVIVATAVSYPLLKWNVSLGELFHLSFWMN